MKKKIKLKNLKNFLKITFIFLVVQFLLFFSFLTNKAFATNEIIESQADALNISSFLETSQNSTDDAFSDLDYDAVFDGLISGDTSSINLLSGIKNKFKKEFNNFIGVIARNIRNSVNT